MDNEKKMLSVIDSCRSLAHKLKENIHNLSESAIVMAIKDLCYDCQEEGYRKKTNELDARRKTNESKRDASWKSVLTEIDDKTHGGFKDNLDSLDYKQKN